MWLAECAKVLKRGVSKVVDVNDERNVQRVIEEACPDDKVRTVALSILAEAIKP